MGLDLLPSPSSETLQAQARSLLDRGPAPLSPGDRHLLPDLADDLDDATDPVERAFLIEALLRESSELVPANDDRFMVRIGHGTDPLPLTAQNRRSRIPSDCAGRRERRPNSLTLVNRSRCRALVHTTPFPDPGRPESVVATRCSRRQLLTVMSAPRRHRGCRRGVDCRRGPSSSSRGHPSPAVRSSSLRPHRSRRRR